MCLGFLQGCMCSWHELPSGLGCHVGQRGVLPHFQIGSGGCVPVICRCNLPIEGVQADVSLLGALGQRLWLTACAEGPAG